MSAWPGVDFACLIGRRVTATYTWPDAMYGPTTIPLPPKRTYSGIVSAVKDMGDVLGSVELHFPLGETMCIRTAYGEPVKFSINLL